MTRKDPLIAPNLVGRQPSPEEQRILDRLPQEQEPKTVVSDQSLNKIQHARELGLAGADMSDPLNQMMRYGFYKDLRRDFKKGDDEKMSMREMMEMAMLNKMMGPSQDSQQSSPVTKLEQMVADLKAENERHRQYYEDKLKEQDAKIREMVFEKKIQDMQEDIQGDRKNLSNQLSSLEQKIEALKNVPPNPTPEQKKDAIEQLEEIGGQVERIKKALSPFGFLSQGQPSAPGTDPYKNPDGSIDYFRFTVDKLDNTVGRVMSAWEKKTPERKKVAETPTPEEPQYRYRELSPEEYCNILLNNPNRTPQEQQWLENYREYLNKQLSQLQPKPKLQPQPKVQPQAPQESLASEPKCSLCGSPGIFKEGLCEKCWAVETEKQEKKTSMIEKLKAQEEEDLRRSRDLGL